MGKKKYVMMHVPEGEGGGGHSICIVWWVCAAQETPIFKPKLLFLPVHIIFSFTNGKKKSVPEHYHFNLPGRFYIFAILETIVFKISFRSSCYLLKFTVNLITFFTI